MGRKAWNPDEERTMTVTYSAIDSRNKINRSEVIAVIELEPNPEGREFSFRIKEAYVTANLVYKSPFEGSGHAKDEDAGEYVNYAEPRDKRYWAHLTEKASREEIDRKVEEAKQWVIGHFDKAIEAEIDRIKKTRKELKERIAYLKGKRQIWNGKNAG